MYNVSISDFRTLAKTIIVDAYDLTADETGRDLEHQDGGMSDQEDYKPQLLDGGIPTRSTSRPLMLTPPAARRTIPGHFYFYVFIYYFIYLFGNLFINM